MATDKVKKPPAPPEEYIKFERRDPSRADLDHIQEVAAKLGIRPGLMGALINHESAGTWHSHIRPAAPGKPLKITTTGEVRGEAGSSALGIAQYTSPTFLYGIYRHGEEIIREAGLEQSDPATADLIRSVNRKMQEHMKLTKGKANWNFFDDFAKKNKSDKQVAALLDLRADGDPKTGQSGRIPFYVLGHDLRDYQGQLLAAGFEVNATNVYALHHGDLGDLTSMIRNPQAAPAVSNAAVANNGAIFKKETEEGTVRKNGAETLQTYRALVSDAHASAFERQYLGRDFGASADEGRLRKVKAADGQALEVRTRLLIPKLSAQEFLDVWRRPNPALEDAPSVEKAVGALERLGVDFGKQRPADAKNGRLRDALSVFKQQAGLPYPESGLDSLTLQQLQLAVGRVDQYAQLQGRQRAAMTEPTALDLVQLGKSVSKLKKDDPARQQAEVHVKEIKEALAGEGLLARPPRNRGFDGSVDKTLLGALRNYQLEKGLADTKGVMDMVTLGLLRKTAQPQLRSEAGPESGEAVARFNDMATVERVSVAALSASMDGQTLQPVEPAPVVAVRVPPSGSGPRYS